MKIPIRDLSRTISNRVGLPKITIMNTRINNNIEFNPLIFIMR